MMAYFISRKTSAPRGSSNRTRSAIAGGLAFLGGLLVLGVALLPALKTGSLHPALVGASVLPLLLAGPAIGYMSMKLRQMSRRNRELEHTATHDGMTSLLNRSAFAGTVSQKLREIAAAVNGCGAFLLIDADHFKRINDCHGHAMGDRALCQIAAHLNAVSRSGDVIGRLGGEEFGLFLPGAALPSAQAAAERLRREIAAASLTGPNGEPVTLSVSIGGLCFRGETDFEAIFQHADRKLYEAKANGRNRSEFAEHDAFGALAPAASTGQRSRRRPFSASSAR
jgi:diguanylate cyclase